MKSMKVLGMTVAMVGLLFLAGCGNGDMGDSKSGEMKQSDMKEDTDNNNSKGKVEKMDKKEEMSSKDMESNEKMDGK
ncbi:hypothetical protein ACSU64_20130 [Bacillaceae bacterium C204]|uniref:hypothetical protein n=1 Tax=Neobacillus sp. 204 TaxID=3383351 RepID=UPI00397CCB65